MTPLVVHVPHASTHIPGAFRDQFILDDFALAKEAEESADLFTDRLAHEVWPSASIIEFPLSRLVVDVERYAREAEEPMAAVGRGMIYAQTHDGLPLRRALSNVERRTLKQNWYDPHWSRLRNATRSNLLIDLHSYPERPWPIEPSPDTARPEIDIGSTEGVTPPVWLEAIFGHFTTAGYDVGLNTPYDGVIDAGAAAAVMIEIRRDLISMPGGAAWRDLVACLRALPTHCS